MSRSARGFKSSSRFQTLYDKVLVRRIEHEETSKSGLIVIPEAAKNKPAIGHVIAVGHGIPERDGGLRPLHVQTGDLVAWSQFAGQEIELEDGEYVVISEEEILGIFRGAA